MKIVEIFKSLQGEGPLQGLPTVFVRLSGCNLNCAWCDTKYAREGGEEMFVDDIIDTVRALHCQNICITGGEPLLQEEQLLILLDRLKEASFTIGIETNGTLDFRQAQRFATICMDMKCPSSDEESDRTLLPYLRAEDCVKFVVGDETDCEYAKKVILGSDLKGQIFISPVEGADYAKMAAFVVDNNLPARFQLQLHKQIGVQ